MIRFPNCKINLGLEIKAKRADGFHDLETVFYPLGIRDVLEIIPAHKEQVESVVYAGSGLVVEGSSDQNLCVKAYRLLKKDFPGLPPIQLHLHKTIPTGAGLGGGSADAAFALQLLNEMFNLNLSSAQLAGYAIFLGSDCPFFLLNQPAIASGRGERLEKISLDLSGYSVLLVHPGIHINTGWAFSQLTLRSTAGYSLGAKINQPVSTWKYNLFNDFEAPVFYAHPEIKNIKQMMYEEGAIYASMSGSGSSVYGIFEKNTVPVQKLPSHYFCKMV